MRRLLVIGLGVTGRSVAKFAVARGDAVTVVDDEPSSERYRTWAAEASSQGVALMATPRAEAWRALIGDADLVVPSPGVPERHVALQLAAELGVAIRSEVDLAAEIAVMPLVAVSGTNGKTTVATMITAMLEGSGIRACAAGNIGRPLLDAVRDDFDVVVAEVSSFQLRFVTHAFRPKVSVLLNVADDHMDWHPSMESYAEAKAGIFRYQRDDDIFIACGDDARALAFAALAPARCLTYQLQPDGEVPQLVRLAGDPIAAALGEILLEPGLLDGLRAFDRPNAVAAAAAAFAAGATPAGISAAIRDFRGLPHRTQHVGDVGGVAFVDDSKATNPHATLRAIQGFSQIILIAGGRNKGLDLSVLRSGAPRIRAVVAIGEAAGEVVEAFRGAVDVVCAESMHEAVVTAATRAQPGDTVLLSPACASFDWYENYGARGDDFTSEVAALLDQQRGASQW